MEITPKMQEYIDRAPTFDEHMMEQLQDPVFQTYWLELTLQEFLEDGNLNRFIRCLTYVVKARVRANGYGAITKLAKDLNIDRSNLSEIINGNKQPRLETAFKLLNGLGYRYSIKLQTAS